MHVDYRSRLAQFVGSLLLLAVAVAGSSSKATAATVTLAPDDVNRIISNLPGSHFADEFSTYISHFVLDQNQRTLVKTTNASFNAALLDALGPGPYTITSAILTVGDETDAYAPIASVGAHRVLVPYDSNTVTYSAFNGLAGTHYEAAVAASSTVSSSVGRSWDLTALVQNWLDGTTDNYGLFFPYPADFGVYTSAENYTSKSTVRWTITAEAVPEPSAGLMAGLGLLVLGRLRRNTRTARK